MLYIVSVGLWDEKDLSLRGLETAKSCNEIYLELYTVNMNTTPTKLSKLIGKPVKMLERGDLEERSGILLEKARSKDIAIMVGGDALTATTHITLLEEAKRLGIKTKVIHGSSILTAVGETGLQLYKFGRTTTLSQDFSDSCYKAIKANMSSGLHTLLLLDIGMDAQKALKILGKRMDPATMVVAACHLGGDAAIRYGSLKDLSNDKSIAKTPAVLVIPGELHFMEKEFLESI